MPENPLTEMSKNGGAKKSVTEQWLEKIEIASEDQKLVLELGLEAADFVEMDAMPLIDICKAGGISTVSIVTMLKGTDDIPEEAAVLLDGMVGDSKEAFYWVYAIIMALLLITLPSLCIYLPWRYSENEATEVTKENVAGRVVVPAIGIFVFVLILVPKMSLHLASDTVEERSANVNLKQLLSDQVTNIGIVSALLLTMIVAAIQADAPTESTTSILSAWYIVFLIYGTYFSFSSTVMCAMMLMYIGPLEGGAAEAFIRDMALYAGEPGTYVVFTTWASIMSTIIWIGGTYGDAPFGIAVAIFTFTLVRCAVVLQNLEGWKNPFISEETRSKRGQVMTLKEIQESQKANA
jgi:hypothetical protein